MNVSKLTDVELNRAMNWLYGCGQHCDDWGDYWNHELEYLLNWSLTMPLAVENMNKIKNMEDIGELLQETFKPALRAICEVLVMIKMEGK